MMKDVVISLHSTQNTGTDEEDTIEFSTDGMYTYDGENACITYLESEVTGLTGTRTSVIVMPEATSRSRISCAAHSEALTSLTSLPRYALIASPIIP